MFGITPEVKPLHERGSVERLLLLVYFANSNRTIVRSRDRREICENEIEQN